MSEFRDESRGTKQNPAYESAAIFFFANCDTRIANHDYLCALKKRDDDSVAQLVEHNTFNVGVEGSSPSGITPRAGERNLTGFSFSVVLL